ncbi:hypothetical protein BD560DRAFT_421746 [Blakeslea trispora]|nr:hypothetical protein BD560DRAFT_421746 [Blakeslea trispora]
MTCVHVKFRSLLSFSAVLESLQSSIALYLVFIWFYSRTLLITVLSISVFLMFCGYYCYLKLVSLLAYKCLLSLYFLIVLPVVIDSLYSLLSPFVFLFVVSLVRIKVDEPVENIAEEIDIDEDKNQDQQAERDMSDIPVELEIRLKKEAKRKRKFKPITSNKRLHKLEENKKEHYTQPVSDARRTRAANMGIFFQLLILTMKVAVFFGRNVDVSSSLPKLFTNFK